MIRPGLMDRLEWMSKNVYATYRCGACINDSWCDKCKQSTLDANGDRLPSEWSGQRKALEDFIAKRRDKGDSK